MRLEPVERLTCLLQRCLAPLVSPAGVSRISPGAGSGVRRHRAAGRHRVSVREYRPVDMLSRGEGRRGGRQGLEGCCAAPAVVVRVTDLCLGPEVDVEREVEVYSACKALEQCPARGSKIKSSADWHRLHCYSKSTCDQALHKSR